MPDDDQQQQQQFEAEFAKWQALLAAGVEAPFLTSDHLRTILRCVEEAERYPVADTQSVTIGARLAGVVVHEPPTLTAFTPALRFTDGAPADMACPVCGGSGKTNV